MDASSEHKEITKYLRRTFGGKSSTKSVFEDDSKQTRILVLSVEDCPFEGATSHCTVGLSDYVLFRNGAPFPARVEFMAACYGKDRGLEHVLATSAFCVINSKWFCAPGVVFSDVVQMHGASPTLADVYFTTPYLWDNLAPLELADRKVSWLQIVPISKAESEYARMRGSDRFEESLERRNVNVLDLGRASIY